MATAKKAATKSPGKGLANWDEELARYAQKIADNERASGGGLKKFSLQSGVLSLDDAPMPGNQMAVIILGSIYENVFYEGDYDSKNPAPPVCFAQALEEAHLAPHDTVVEREQAQHEQCEGCPMNEFGTAATGRGKACKNGRRLIVIPAGSYDKRGELTLIDEPAHFDEVEAAYLLPPVTSVKGYVSYVKQLAVTLRRPPFGVITRVALVPDAKSQFRMEFEAIAPIEDTNLFETLVRRHEAAERTLMEDSAYNLDQREPPPPPRGRASAKPVARKGATAKAAPAKGAPKRKY